MYVGQAFILLLAAFLTAAKPTVNRSDQDGENEILREAAAARGSHSIFKRDWTDPEISATAVSHGLVCPVHFYCMQVF
jgi:hypothetical protein